MRLWLYITHNLASKHQVPTSMAKIDLTVSKNTLRTNYCFTYNNYTHDGESTLKRWLTENTKYAVFGHEVAPTTGTPHLQGFFALKKQSRITTLQNSLRGLGISMSIFAANGNAQQNRDYCSKSDSQNLFEHGTIINPGKRSDLDDLAQSLRTDTFINVALQNPAMTIKYSRGMRELKMLYDSISLPKNRDVTVSVYYGDAGTGKTRRALETCEKIGLSFYMVNSPQGGSIWYDGYVGQQAIIIDDFYGWIKPHDLYRLLDRYPLQLPIKGSHVWAQYSHVFITSNTEPLEWYKQEVKDRLDLNALARRLHNVYGMYWRDAETKESVWIRTTKEEKKIVAPCVCN